MPTYFLFYWSVGLGLATVSGAFGMGLGMAHQFFERSTLYVFDDTRY